MTDGIIEEKRRDGYIVTKLGDVWYAALPDWHSPPQYLANGKWKELK